MRMSPLPMASAVAAVQDMLMDKLWTTPGTMQACEGKAA